MSNTINMNRMASYYNNFIPYVAKKSMAAKATTGGVQNGTATGESDFMSVVESREETSSANGLQKAGQMEVISTKDMTLEEYKKHIREKISSLPFCADKMNDSYSVNISDDGFTAMQNDPEYEKWVLDELKTTFETPYPSLARAIRKHRYCVMHFGATKEECYCMSWGNSYQNGNGNRIWEAQSEESFWTRRGNQKKIQKQIDKKTAEKKEMEKYLLKEWAKKRQSYTEFLNGRAMCKFDGISELHDMFADSTASKIAGLLSAYESGTFVGNGIL